MNALRQTVAPFALAGYVFLAVFGLLATGYLHQHSTGSMSNCPFMVGQHSLCAMNFTEHVVSWKNLITGTVGELVLLLVPLFFVSFFILLHPPNLARNRYYARPCRENFITTLFSQGILHPKAP
ncbi:MAG TPA: hypothetical protein VGE18_02690 [Candidatus Paceibacterota bacterium]